MKDRQWSLICHLSGLAGYVIPLGNIIAPMVVRSLKKHQYPKVEIHAKEVINFQISFTIWMVIAAVFIYFNIGIWMLILLIAVHISLMIYAAKKAEDGILFRYPFTVRFLQ
ncbi:MAG: DUF4870 domain-containing protein [Cyclobacteriaceae bacterium]|nr:DUF4870 domain-containing protein [Cyclobacteriaceae bacterium]